MPTEESKIFISYSREDSDFALRLGKDLKAKGLNVWLDQLDILPGQNWDMAVENGLQKSDRFLIILSPASVSSENVMDELSLAIEEKRSIIPVLHIECKIPFRIRRKQFSDFTNNYEDGLSDLLRAFEIITEIDESEDSEILEDKTSKTAAIKSGQTEEEYSEAKRKADTKNKEKENIRVKEQAGLKQKADEAQKLKELANSKKLEEEKKINESSEKTGTTYAPENSSETPYSEKNKYKIPLIIASVIAVLVLVIWIVNSSGNNKATTEPIQAQSENLTDLEKEAWDAAVADNTIEGFKSYQQNYPQGNHFGDAQKRIETINDTRDWQKAFSLDTKKSYQEYLKTHPGGLYITKAKRKIEYFESQSSQEQDRQKQAIAEKEKLAEDNAWNTAKSNNTVDQYQNYIRKYPNGKYTSDARKMVKELEYEAKKALQDGAVGSVVLDGRTYATIRLAGKTWMTQNMDYNIPSKSWHYADLKSATEQSKYGRLYTWDAAKRVCMALGNGWHLPTDREWSILMKSFGSGSVSYQALIEGGNSGLSLLLGGVRFSGGGFGYLGEFGNYWSATESGANNAWNFAIEKGSGLHPRDDNDKDYAFSCRCVKD